MFGGWGDRCMAGYLMSGMFGGWGCLTVFLSCEDTASLFCKFLQYRDFLVSHNNIDSFVGLESNP